MKRAPSAACLFAVALGVVVTLAPPAPAQPTPAPPAPATSTIPAAPSTSATPSTPATTTPAAPAAPADRAARADALFQEGIQLVAAGNFEEACPRFAASHEADPGYGAVLNLGECHLTLKRTASAWRAFRAAADLARAAGQSDRVKEATGRMRAVEPALNRLTISFREAPAGLRVELDGVEVPLADLGTPIPLDPGQHAVTASAPGRKAFSQTLTVSGKGQSLTVTPALVADARPSDPGPGERPAAGRGFPVDRILALAGLGLAVAGGVTGGVLGEEASSRWDRAKPGCNAKNQCTPESIALGNEARTLAHGSTAAFVIGGAGLAGAVVLWLTSRTVTRVKGGRVAWSAGAAASPAGGGVSVHGTF